MTLFGGHDGRWVDGRHGRWQCGGHIDGDSNHTNHTTQIMNTKKKQKKR